MGAEVVSMEPEFEPAASPPAYPTSAAASSADATEGVFPVPPVRNHTEFPVDCAVPSILTGRCSSCSPWASVCLSMPFDRSSTSFTATCSRSSTACCERKRKFSAHGAWDLLPISLPAQLGALVPADLLFVPNAATCDR